jgi:hypothetical protein
MSRFLMQDVNARCAPPVLPRQSGNHNTYYISVNIV